VTGASGFLGGQLVERLARTGDPVRAGVRDPSAYRAPEGVEVVAMDLEDERSVEGALEGAGAAYYLVHSMDEGDDAAAADRAAAEAFVRAADRADLERIVYVGAVGYRPGGPNSPHLASRHEVERILGSATAELVVLRTSMVVGAGSASFRSLAEIVQRLPVLPLPPWRASRSQPIHVGDVLRCLARARSVPPGAYDLVGPDALSVEEMMEAIADALGRSLRTVPLPISVPAVEGPVAGAIADEDRRLLTGLLESLQRDTLAPANDAPRVFGIEPTPFREAVRRAVAELGWLDADG